MGLTPPGHVLHPQSKTVTPIQNKFQIAVVKGAMPVICHVCVTRVTASRTKWLGSALLDSFFDIKGRRQPAWRTCLQSGAHTGKDKGCISSANRLDRPWEPPSFYSLDTKQGCTDFPKISQTLQNSCRQKCHKQQGPFWGPTDIKRQRGDGDVRLAVTQYSARSRMSGAIPPCPHTLSYNSEPLLHILTYLLHGAESFLRS